MRLALALLLLLPQLAYADWAKTLDTDCRCEHAFPTKPSDSTRPSPWPKLSWHRSEARVSPTEWYAVSYVAFDGADVPSKALTDALAQLVGKGTPIEQSAVKGQIDATIKRPDGSVIKIRIVSQGRRVYVLEVGDIGAGTKPDQLFAGFHAWTDKDATPEGQTAGMTGAGTLGGGTLGGSPAQQGTVVLGAIKLAAGKLDLDATTVILKKAVPRTVDCFDHVTKPAAFAITLDITRSGGTTPTITGLDGDPKACMHEVFTNAPIGKPLDDNPATLVINASYKPPAKH